MKILTTFLSLSFMSLFIIFHYTVTYVKLYLVKNRKCLAKAKTTLSNKRTLDPLFQQQLTFHEDYHGCILQVS